MKRTIFVSLLVFVASVLKAQTYQETVDFLSQHVSKSCFTNCGGIFLESIYSNDENIVETLHCYSIGYNYTETVTIPLNKIISFTINGRVCNYIYLQIGTQGNEIKIEYSGTFPGESSTKTSHTDLYINNGCEDTGEGGRIINAFSHLTALNKKNLPHEAF